MNKYVKNSLKIAISLAILFFLFFKIDFKSFLENISKSNIYLIIFAALIAYPGVYVSVIKWRLSLQHYGLKIKKLKLYSLYSISSFFNNFLPTTVGGDFYKYYYLKKSFNTKRKEILSSILLERGFGFISLFLINILLLPIYYPLLNDYGLILLELAIIGGFFMIISSIWWIPKFQIKSLKKWALLNKFYSLLNTIYSMKNKKVIIWSLLYSILFLCLVVFSTSLLFMSFNLKVPFLYILFVSTIIQIMGVLPISLNSIGITEGLNMFLYYLIGVSFEVSLAVALISRISVTLTSSIGGLFYIFNDKIQFN